MMEPIQLATFGEVLKILRKKKKLTQRQLAARLGVHYNTIWAWERGDYLPDTKGIILELAQQLGLDDAETRQLLESSLTALSSRWSVPYQRNPYFTGREMILQQIHDQLSPRGETGHPRSLALSGLGGMGKTQTALEYAYRHTQDYTAIFWLQAENPHQLRTDLVALAEILNLPQWQEQEQSRVLKAVQRWLSTHRDWLLILDNVQEIAAVHELLPGVREGSLLFTTRLSTLGALALLLPLESLSRDEALLFLGRRVRPGNGHRPMLTSQEQRAAKTLCEAMDGLPLALDQAGAYLQESGCQLADYLQRYREQRKQVLARRGLHEGSHPDSVAVTVKLSLEQAAREHPAAPDLLRFCAFLHPTAIPEDVLVAGAPYLGPALEPCVADPYQFDQVLAALRSASLVQRQNGPKVLTIHRLVQEVCQDMLKPAEVDLWRERVLLALNAAFPDITHETWAVCERLSPHVSLCLHALSEEILPHEQQALARKMAEYLKQRGHYQEAEFFLQRALDIQEHLLGLEHPEGADLLCQQANLLYRQSRYAEAKRLYQRALALQEQVAGPEHPGMALALNGLADICFNRGLYCEAEEFYRKAFSIQERTLEPGDPTIALFYYNLAEIALQQGKYAEARVCYQCALNIQEKARGLEHPDVAHTLDGLARLNFEEGRYTEAEALFQRALSIREHALGAEHPDVATILNNIAGIYYTQGREAEAEPLWSRALLIWEQELGPEHPNLAYPLCNLAELYASQKRYQEAEAFYQRVCAILEHAVGSEYHMLSHPLSGLAAMYTQQGRYEEAEPLYQQALALCEKQLGASHPQTAQIRSALAELSQQQETHE